MNEPPRAPCSLAPQHRRRASGREGIRTPGAGVRGTHGDGRWDAGPRGAPGSRSARGAGPAKPRGLRGLRVLAHVLAGGHHVPGAASKAGLPGSSGHAAGTRRRRTRTRLCSAGRVAPLLTALPRVPPREGDVKHNEATVSRRLRQVTFGWVLKPSPATWEVLAEVSSARHRRHRGYAHGSGVTESTRRRGRLALVQRLYEIFLQSLIMQFLLLRNHFRLT